MNADKDKATPRPWRINESGAFLYVIQDGTDDEAVATMGGLPEMFANAALIVAAVNAYAAHRQLAEAARAYLDDWEPARDMDQLRAALAALDAVEKP